MKPLPRNVTDWLVSKKDVDLITPADILHSDHKVRLTATYIKQSFKAALDYGFVPDRALDSAPTETFLSKKHRRST